MTRTGSDAGRGVAALAGIAVLALCLSLTGSVQACEIPVYHYALENWEPDPWDVLVFHRGELSSSERAAVELMRNAADHRQGHGNLIVQTVDLAANPDAIMMQRWGEQGTGQLPWVAAYYPAVRRISQPAWAGPLKTADVRALLDSPLRQKISRELASRVTTSWVLLESGDRGKDNAAWRLLERELRRLEETLVLPVLEGWGPDGAANEPEDVKFTMHRLSRDTSAERMLVNMLLHSEPDLATDFAHEPLVFPIYGRGLILYALAGAGINEWTITQAAEFVTGPCSCQVKASNPGTDLLVQRNWDAEIRQTARERMPPPSGLAGFQARAEEVERRLGEADRARGSTTEAAGTASRQQGATEVRAPVTGSEPRASTPRVTEPRSPARTAPSPPQQSAGADSPGPTADPRPASGPEHLDGEPGSGEPLGPPDPDQITSPDSESAAGDGSTGDDVDYEPQPFDELGGEDPMAATLTPGDSDKNRGVAGLVAMLGLIAAGITALGAAIVLRTRQNAAVKDDDHERIAT